MDDIQIHYWYEGKEPIILSPFTRMRVHVPRVEDRVQIGEWVYTVDHVKWQPEKNRVHVYLK